MLILVWEENEQDEAHIVQGIYFESFQIHQLTIIDRFEHTHIFYFKILTNSFCMGVFCINNIFNI